MHPRHPAHNGGDPSRDTTCLAHTDPNCDHHTYDHAYERAILLAPALPRYTPYLRGRVANATPRNSYTPCAHRPTTCCYRYAHAGSTDDNNRKDAADARAHRPRMNPF
jgi:hypothetical protein